MFVEFDTDGNGSLSLLELKLGLESLDDVDISIDEIESILKKARISPDGEIEYEEFLRLMTN